MTQPKMIKMQANTLLSLLLVVNAVDLGKTPPHGDVRCDQALGCNIAVHLPTIGSATSAKLH